jgi:acetate kinase
VILAVNTGSSSVRLAAFDGVTARERRRFERGQGDVRAFGEPELVVHRVVHGGGKFSTPVEIDDAVFRELEALTPLAPLHQPPALEWIQKTRSAFPKARQFAAFDTGFFAQLPEVARTYALPPSLGARRYGFHGLAHAAMWRQLKRTRGRAITLQLGGGCSATAILDGKPLDTSMGMTPLEGLMMATRPGDLDPSLKLDDELLNHQSGLLGLSGISADIREVLKSPSERAQLAIALYCYRIKKYLGAYLAVLGGLDALVFAGGVGEHQPPIRSRILLGMAPFGLEIDEQKNDTNAPRIERGPVEIHVVSSDEEQEMVDALKELGAV